MASVPSSSPAGQYAQLRSAIKHQLQQLGVSQEVHQMLVELSQRAGNPQTVTAATVLELLEARGLVKQLANSIGPPNRSLATLIEAAQPEGGLHAKADASGARPLLHVKVLAARAFTEYVVREPLPGERLALHGELFGQRFHSAPVAATPEPDLVAEAFLELPAGQSHAEAGTSPLAAPAVPAHGESSGAAEPSPSGLPPPTLGVSDALRLLAIRQPMHLSVVQLLPASPGGPEEGRSSVERHVVVALGAAEWRTVLVRKRSVTISVQLSSGPAGLASGLPSVPAGMLVLQLSLAPTLTACLDEPLLASQQRMEGARDAEAMAAFLARARAWWAEFISLRADFRARPVKVLARSEDGCQYPACTFLSPLQLGRSIATPRQAARFVSLLRRREDEEDAASGAGAGIAGASSFQAAAASVGGVVDGAVGCWCPLHTVLASGSASREEAALLLCGLLLGFGLDAWVLVGRLHSGAGHTWVLTRGPLAAPCFWEPATGVRYTPEDVASWPYLSVGCAFNPTRTCANCQHDDALPLTSFLFEDAALWRTLEVAREEVPGPCWVPQELEPPAPDPERRVESDLESRVMEELARYRSQSLGGAATQWDSSLAHLLMPALEAYEHEAVSGEVAPGNAEFQQGVKRAVPLGWLFKGFPLHQRHAGAWDAAHALMLEPQAQDILATRTPGAMFAFRARVFAYPEGLYSVWMMLAVKYKGP